MRNDFRIIYCKVSVYQSLPCADKWICLKNTGWPPDLCTSAHVKRVSALFGGLRKSTWQSLSSYLEISLETQTVQTLISRYVEREELRSKGKYTRQYPYVIGLFKICIITAHAHVVDTRPSLSSPSRRSDSGDESNLTYASQTRYQGCFQGLVMWLSVKTFCSRVLVLCSTPPF